MPLDTPLISTIVAGLVLAFLFGTIARRLRLPPLIGYLAAGIAVGPYTPGFVADTQIATGLSEIGVILLMFGVGLHFSLKDVLSVRAIALPGAAVQIAGATAMGVGLAMLMGWPLAAGLIFGLALSVPSTVVLLMALQDRHLVERERGRIAVGWLIVADIAMVLALVLIPALAPLMGGSASHIYDPFIGVIERLTGTGLNIWGVLGITLLKLIAFVGFMLIVGRRAIPWALHMSAHTGSRELSRLAVLAIALGVAAGTAYLFGVPLALGAFLAGTILSESELSQRAARETLPLREAFAVLFFVALGMLFDPAILIAKPLELIGTVFIIVIGKSVLAYLMGVAFRQSVGTSMTISASLAQIGEFSFILATLGVGLGLLPAEGRDLIIAGALISIVLNPLAFRFAESARPRAEARAAARRPGVVVPHRVEPGLDSSVAPSPPADLPGADVTDEPIPTGLAGHIVLAGYGSVGSVVAEGMKKAAQPFVLIEDSEKKVAAARAEGLEVVAGNAATPEALALANIAAAKLLLVAIPDAFEAGQVVQQSRRINQGLTIIARAHSDDEGAHLRELGANEVLMGAREIGIGMLGWTNGEHERRIAAERKEARLAAVANALRVEPPATPAEPAPQVEPATLSPAPLPADGTLPVDELEAAIEAAAPAHPVTGPAEPPEVVPAPGEMPEPASEGAEPADGEAGPSVPPVLVMSGELLPIEPVFEAPVRFAEGPVVEGEIVEIVPPRPAPPAATPAAPATRPGEAFRGRTPDEDA